MAYAAAFLAVLGGYLLLQDLPWRAPLDVLLSTEWASAVLASCVGSLALIRFYSRKEITFLFVGIGFIVHGVLGGIHAGTIFSYSTSAPDDNPLPQIAWSWYTSRLFLPVLLWLSWYFGNRERRLGEGRGISDKFVYVTVLFLALVLYLPFHLYALREGPLSGSPLPSSFEYLPAVFLCLALVGYYRDGNWKTDAFRHWLILAIIANLMGEMLLMPVTQQNYDIAFIAAHCLNLAVYLFAFVGLMFNMHRLFSESRTHQELLLKNVILSTQQEASPDAMLVVDEAGAVVSCNRRFMELWRVPERLARSRQDIPLLQRAAAQARDPKAFLARIGQLHENKHERGNEEILLRDGRIIDSYTAPIADGKGGYYGRIWYFRDVTEMERRQQELRESEARFRSLVELSLIGIALIEDGRFTYVNRKLSDLFGYGVKEMTGMAPAAMAADAARGEIARVLASDGEMSEFTFEGARKDKSALYIEGRSARMNFEGKPGLILTLMDVTERVRARQAVEKLQAQLLEQAIRDPLTGLYNRRYLDDVIGRELARAKRGGYPLALVMGDIDYFKAVNDTCGHPAGDAVLRRFAEMLRRHSRSGDILCRYGGEEFVLVLPHMDQETAYTRAEQLCTELAATEIIYQSMTIRVTASFGVAVFSPGQDGEALIAAADKALYRAKHAGRNTVTAYAA